jgi:hypothetical protein
LFFNKSQLKKKPFKILKNACSKMLLEFSIQSKNVQRIALKIFLFKLLYLLLHVPFKVFFYLSGLQRLMTSVNRLNRYAWWVPKKKETLDELGHMVIGQVNRFSFNAFHTLLLQKPATHDTSHICAMVYFSKKNVILTGWK